MAVSISDPNNDDVWVSELARKTLTRLTIAPELDNVPVWSPDSQKVIFASTRQGGQFGFYSKQADGTGPVESLIKAEHGETSGFFRPYSWSADGKTLAFGYTGSNTGPDIGVLVLDGGSWSPMFNTVFAEGQPAISPDGRWIAYTSDASGQAEIYAEPDALIIFQRYFFASFL